MKKYLLTLFWAIAMFFGILAISESQSGQVVSWKEHENFITKLKVSGFTEEEINEIFTDERVILLPEILWKKKPEPIDYFSEEFGMFNTDSIRQGREILKQRAEILNSIEQRFGVEKEILVSLWRIESNFGNYLGKGFVFNYLYRLFVFKIKDWAEKEMINFLVLCKMNGYDPLSIKGSWAGCFGYWQFMPSSFLKFAIDGDDDGKIDLFSFTDGAFSAANYLNAHGWKKNFSLYQPASKDHMLYRYNKDVNYILAVLFYAKIINNQHGEF